MWILPYAILLSLPELFMDIFATSKNFVNTVYSEASLLYDELEEAESDAPSDSTADSDTDSYTVEEKED